MKAFDKEILIKIRRLFLETLKLQKNNKYKRFLEYLNLEQKNIFSLLKSLQSDTTTVGFAGITNAGKSTFLSALFNYKIAPMANKPTTCCPTEFIYSKQTKAFIVFDHTYRRNFEEFDSLDELYNFLEANGSENGKNGNSYTIKKIVAELDNNLLSNKLTIIDTPGYGAVLKNNKEEEHTKKLIQSLDNMDKVYWVVKEDIGKEEIEFFQNYLFKACNDVIVNIRDDWSEDEKDRYREKYFYPLKPGIKTYFINAKQILSNNEERNTASDFLKFKEQLVAFSRKRSEEIIAEQIDKIEDLNYFLRNTYNIEDVRTVWAIAETHALLSLLDRDYDKLKMQIENDFSNRMII